MRQEDSVKQVINYATTAQLFAIRHQNTTSQKYNKNLSIKVKKWKRISPDVKNNEFLEYLYTMEVSFYKRME